MCGFAGFIGSPDPDALVRMGERIRHRGPDQDGTFVSDGCSFTHKRLSIIDLSEAGRQPMTTEDGRFTIAYNGEIYNYRELRRRYENEGWKFRTQTDTECFLASAALHELRDLKDFHGMFAFALWDRDEGRCFLARDRMGIKPLYLTTPGDSPGRLPGKVAFASEIGALLELDRAWTLDERARASFFAVGYVSGYQTIFSGIESLSPGRLFVLKHGKIVHSMDFGFPPNVPTRMHWDEARGALERTVDGAVEQQLVSDRPVGVFLSGGLDSTVVLSSMRKARPGAEIKTFTTRFRHQTTDQKFNRDAELAKRTAERYGCDHHEIEVGPEDVMREASAIALRLGQPHANHSVTALDAAARLASASVPVVLSGDGGDESFGGYDRYRLYARVGPWLANGDTRAFIWAVAQFHPRHEEWRDLIRGTSEAARMLSFHAAPSMVRKRFFGKAMDDRMLIQDWNNFLRQGLRGTFAAARFMALDRNTWLQEDAFVRSDRLTMRHGLELRVPLTDDAVVAFAASLPASFHVTSRGTKRLWRATFADRCLPEVVNEPKRGWFPPTAKWMREELRDWTRDLLEDAIRDHTWMNGTALREAFDDHLEKRAYHLNELWMVVGYQLWWRAHRAFLTSR